MSRPPNWDADMDEVVRTAECVLEWTSVEDALPEPGVKVLAWERDYEIAVYGHEYAPTGWMIGCLSFELRVTHWMPLPEGPE